MEGRKVHCNADTKSREGKQKGLRCNEMNLQKERTAKDEKGMTAESSWLRPLQIIKVSLLLPGSDWGMMSSSLKMGISMQVTELRRGDEESSEDSPQCLLQQFPISSVWPQH